MNSMHADAQIESAHVEIGVIGQITENRISAFPYQAEK
jgi:hypothetical protein